MAPISRDRLSRRQLIKCGGLVGMAAAVPTHALRFGFAALGGSAQALAQSASQDSSKPSITMRLSYGQVFSLAPFFIAAADKYYEKWGVSATQHPFPASLPMLEGIAAGQLDTASVTAAPGLAAFDKGVPLSMIFPYAYGGDRFAVCVHPDSQIKTLKGLEGKRVAVTFNIAQHQFLIEALKANSVDIGKLQLYNMRGPDMASAFAGKSIDAAVGADPDISNWLKNGIATVLERGGKYFAGLGVFAVRNELIEKHPEDVYRFTLAVMDVYRWMRTKGQTSDEVVAKVAQLLKSDRELARDGLRYIVFDPRITRYTRTSLRKDAEFAIQQGQLSKPPDINRFAVTRFIDRAQREHPEMFADIPAYLKSMNITDPDAFAVA